MSVEYIDAVFETPEHFLEANACFDLSVFQLEAGSGGVPMRQAATEAVSIREIRYPHAYFMDTAFDHGWTSFLLVKGKRSSEGIWCGVRCETDTLLILRSGREHRFRVPSGWHDWDIAIRDDVILESGLLTEEQLREAATPERGHIGISARHSAHLQNVVCTMLDSLGRGSAAGMSAVQVDAQIIDALALALSGSSLSQDQPRQRRRLGRYHIVQQALIHIDPTRDPTVGVQDLIARTGQSYHNLNRAFQDAIGLSPYQFILATRLNAGRRALSASHDRLSVTQISAELGFASSSEFARYFRRFYGQSPRELRQR